MMKSDSFQLSSHCLRFLLLLLIYHTVETKLEFEPTPLACFPVRSLLIIMSTLDLLATICLVWYFFILAVCAIGIFQMYYL